MLKPGETKNVPEEVEAFRKAFDQLLKDAGIKQLIVLIDDLDRCLPDTAIETLEAIRLFVFTARTAFVVAADEAMIEYAVRKHFPDLPDSTGPRDYARNYLEKKLIQVPFRIPALGETETRIYVTLLLAGAEIGENDADYANLIGVAREKLKRPWTSGGLDAATVKTALSKQAEKANNALALSDQIGPILASGTKGNPRQIKRFLNTLLLRERTATRADSGTISNCPCSRSSCSLSASSRGCSSRSRLSPRSTRRGYARTSKRWKGLATADGKESQAGERKGQRAGEPGPALDNAVLTEWRSSETVCDWARLSPKLLGLDLRPYLFVTKDKKDYFGPVSVLGHLAGVVEKLFSGKMTVQGYEAELKQLVQPEAEKVFEAVRTKIMSTAPSTPSPRVLMDLSFLVKAQPGLQGRLMDFWKHCQMASVAHGLSAAGRVSLKMPNAPLV